MKKTYVMKKKPKMSLSVMKNPQNVFVNIYLFQFWLLLSFFSTKKRSSKKMQYLVFT